MTARMRDVAQKAGVSLKTVSNVVNHSPQVTPATRAKVEAAIAELDYRPDLRARSLRNGRCGMIALAIPDLAQLSFAGLAAAVVRAAKNHGIAVLIEQTEGDTAAEDHVLDGLRDRLVDGILWWPTASTGTGNPRRPVVLLGDGCSELAFDRVSLDHTLLPVAPPTQREMLADAAVGLLLDRVAGIGSAGRCHILVPASSRPRETC
ncbi:LacI family DNA-binding transcriptional regulator [Kribbella sp. CA-293567]|uniref:LacI family DNA-binding transcriptional regulator n=1 Tax=Kribbella sp. CA-293567 TaxID=3002436 RepID=UPI0022DDD81B|nr:LacI family DNA-binding transcriptional regulator [Kribbella sp. CA-293567]WBQ03861.1 LacI family DNA-binding transcriptional regulator [Kribbella sp. CA-293567]